MRLKLSADEAEYLKDSLDIWIEEFKDIDEDMPRDVVLTLLSHREMAERIRNKLWRRMKG